MVNTDLTAWLDRIEHQHPVKWDLGLERVSTVGQRLDLLSPAARVITVAGTNGKGSTIAVLDAVLRAQGYRTGVTTSPHLLRFNERICVDGEAIGDEPICDAFAHIEAARREISLSYFEFAALAALWIFQQQQPDIILLEVGLGGRLDAMNIVDPDLAVITAIDLDHQSWLGPDRDTIGREKAGILRARRPCVLGPDMPASVIARARELDAPTLILGRDFDRAPQERHWTFSGRDAAGESVVLEGLPYPNLPLDNTALALQVLLALELLPNTAVAAAALGQARLAGRYQRLLLSGVPAILDVAHNPHAARYLVAKLAADPVPGRTHGVFAMYADKDCESVLATLAPEIDAWYFATVAEARAESAVGLAARGPRSKGSAVSTCDSIAAAIQLAVDRAVSGDRILVCGSFPAVAAALDQAQDAF